MKDLSDFINEFIGEIWCLAFRTPLDQIPFSVWIWQIGVGTVLGILADRIVYFLEEGLGYRVNRAYVVEICALFSILFQVIHVLKNNPLAINLLVSTLIFFFVSVATSFYLSRHRTNRQ